MSYNPDRGLVGLAFWSGACLGALIMMVTILVVSCLSDKSLRTEAVEHGAAIWNVLPNGSTKFEWKENK